jgi:DNA-binding transcriptional MocR family regulator
MDHLYTRLAAEIAAQIDHGVYRPGERLPGVRALSDGRRVSIATAIAAYRRLEESGHIEARPRSGFYVRARRRPAELPGVSRPQRRPHKVSGQTAMLRMIQAAGDPAIVALGAAVPDPSYLPTRLVARALARAAQHHRVRGAGYAFPPGVLELRRQIARRMAEAGAAVHPDEILITQGCQEALTLALRAVTAPGDVVAVESPCYYGHLQIIETLGLKALEIPAHPLDGIALDVLGDALARWPVRACIVTPNFNNPLGHCMPEARRKALVELLAAHAVSLIEDDVYGDLGFGRGRPPLLKSLDTQNVLHCSSFSKTLAPGLRVGWIAPGRHLERVEYLKLVLSVATPGVPQFAVAEILENSGFERHLRRTRDDYRQAVARMSEAVMRHFPEGTRITRPTGGFLLWVEVSGNVDMLTVAERALDAGISIAPGPMFSATQRYRGFFRLSCACRSDERIERALAELARLCRAA